MPAYVNKGLAGYVYPHTTSITPALPPALVAGNVLIACVITITNGATAHSWSAGWTPIDAQINASGIRASLAYRIVDGTDTAPTVSWTSTSIASGQIFQLEGTSASPIGAFGSAFGSTASHSSPAITTTANNSLVLYVDASYSGTVLTTPSGWTQRSSDPDGWDVISIGDKTIATSGSSSGAIAVSTASSGWIEWQLEILSDPNTTGSSSITLAEIVASGSAITDTLASSTQTLTPIQATGSAYSGNESVGVLERILATSSAITDSLGESSQTLTTIIAFSEMTQGPTADASITLASMTIGASAITGVAGVGAVTLSLPTLAASAASEPIPSLELMTINATAITGVVTGFMLPMALELMTVNATVQDIVESDLVFQPITLAATGVTGTLGVGNVTLPKMTVDAVAYVEAVGVGNITMQLMLLNAVAQQTAGSTYSVVAMHAERQALTEYTNFRFNSFCVFNGKVLGANDSGLFELAGATDNGTNIDAMVRGGITDFNSSQLKFLDRVYVGCRSTGNLIFRVIQHDDGVGYDYTIPSGGNAGMYNRRVTTGRGLRSRYYQWEIRNSQGSGFAIDTVDIEASAISRRIGGKDA